MIKFKQPRKQFTGNQTGLRHRDDFGRGVFDHPHLTIWHAESKRLAGKHYLDDRALSKAED